MESDKYLNSLKDNGKTFFFSGLFLSKKQLHKAAKLYYFCRSLDDLGDTDQNPEIKNLKLKNIRNDFNSLDGGEWKEFFNDFELGKKAITDLIDGIKSDLDENFERKGWDSLLNYCYKVAGTVGVLMLNILNVKKIDRALPYSIDLGIAMQLTNIARDVYEDANMGRVYLPIELIGNVEIDSIIEPNEEQEKNIKTSIKNLLYEAEKFYNAALYGTRFIPLKARLPILIAAVCYRDIGRKLIRNDCDTWQERTTISTIKKVVLVLKAVMYLFTKPFNIKKSETSKRNLLKIFLNEDIET